MAEPRFAPRQEATEERTEPFSQSELDARVRNVDVGTPSPDPDAEHVPLDVLLLEDHHHRQNIRVLVRPLAELPNTIPVAPPGDNCRWLALRAEVAAPEQPSHRVLAVTQTARDIKFSVRIPADIEEVDDAFARPELWCELYFDPASDKLILVNRSDVPIALVRLSQAAPVSPSLNDYRIVYPHVTKSLEPGTWRIKVHDAAVLDFRILEKRPVVLYEQPSLTHSQSTCSRGSSALVSTSTKRALAPDDDDDDGDQADKRVKRRISQVQGRPSDGVVMFLNPSADPLVFSLPNGAKRSGKELSSGNTNALLQAEQGDTIYMTGICELDEYQLIKQEPIASTAQSAVFVGRYSKRPDNVVTVKVLKTVVSNAEKPNVHERNVIRQADMWQREYQTQENLEHHSIVRYYGGDARFLSLYMEHVDAKDLTVQHRWRSKQDDHFTGTAKDAARILRDIAGALSYIHGRQLVHNDIKPANILYSMERGAVLCDFGMSTATSSPPGGGGTPYYIPPEFMGSKLRGPAADVWAMGVTMLYLLRKLPLPESRARPQNGNRQLYWLIAGVNNPQMNQRYGNGQSAMMQMRTWLTEVHNAAHSLDREDRLERIVKEMLTPNPTQRITMASVLEQLTLEPVTLEPVAVTA